MSTSNLKKPATSNGAGRTSPSSNRQSSPNLATRTAAKTANNGVARTNTARNGSPISARAAVKKPAGPVATRLSKEDGAQGEEDPQQDTSAIIEDLKARLQSAEEASEDFRKQLEGLQVRLDEALAEQGTLEERVHEEEEKNEAAENEKRESIRQKRELETIYEAERAAFMKEQDARNVREDELQEIIQRLKESLSDKDVQAMGDDVRLSRITSSPSSEAPHFAPSASVQRSSSRNDSKLLLQKDKVIESLRLELAEAQIKLVEVENMGGGRMQELEKTLLETRMANARLMEDNESFQLLLSEKTLNGDLLRQDIMRPHSPSSTGQAASRGNRTSTLADELGLTDSEAGDDQEPKANRVLEAEISSLKDQNKALTVYINKIIERILQRQGGFENILSNVDDGLSGARSIPAANKDKELPPPPPKDTGVSPSSGPSFLERAKSVMGAAARPKTAVQPVPQPTQPSIIEDANTAPSIPLTRATSIRNPAGINKRATVDWSSAATVVTNMYRPGDGIPQSPGLASQRNSFFAFGGTSGRTASGSTTVTKSTSTSTTTNENATPADALNGRDAALAALEGGIDDAQKETQRPSSATSLSEAPSPPRQASGVLGSTGPSIMTGSKMRPLRLVQEKKEADDEVAAARKAANRSSAWIPTGWFGAAKGTDGAPVGSSNPASTTVATSGPAAGGSAVE